MTTDQVTMSQVLYWIDGHWIPLPEAVGPGLDRAKRHMADGHIDNARWWATSIAYAMRCFPSLRIDHLLRWKQFAAELERLAPQAPYYPGGSLLARYWDLEPTPSA